VVPAKNDERKGKVVGERGKGLRERRGKETYLGRQIKKAPGGRGDPP